MYKNSKKQFPGEKFFIPELDYKSQYLPINTKIVKKLGISWVTGSFSSSTPPSAECVSRNKQRACTE